jgi:ketosteroid isomerase-like protein
MELVELTTPLSASKRKNMNIKLSLWIMIAFVAVGERSVASEVMNPSTHEAAIRDARSAFNRAIRQQDADTILSFFAPEYHLITGSSVQAHGIDVQQTMWADTFVESPGFYCQRDIRELSINENWGLAEELGDWNCYNRPENHSTHYSGVFSAKWQRTLKGEWLIQSEVFTTMHCESSDSGCSPPKDISR